MATTERRTRTGRTSAENADAWQRRRDAGETVEQIADDESYSAAHVASQTHAPSVTANGSISDGGVRLDVMRAISSDWASADMDIDSLYQQGLRVDASDAYVRQVWHGEKLVEQRLVSGEHRDHLERFDVRHFEIVDGHARHLKVSDVQTRAAGDLRRGDWVRLAEDEGGAGDTYYFAEVTDITDSNDTHTGSSVGVTLGDGDYVEFASAVAVAHWAAD